MKISRILWLLGFMVVSGCAADLAPTPPKDTKEAGKIVEEEIAWPKTVDEAVMRILATMSEKERKLVRETAKDKLILFHHGWGMGIRNSFGLWRGNRALMEDCKAKHPDAASMVIIEAVWAKLQKENEQPKEAGSK